MRQAARSVGVAVAAFAGVALLVWASTTTAVLKLLGVTVLVMGGTGHPLSSTADTDSYVEDYLNDAIDNYVDPASMLGTGIPTGPYNAVAVVTPEESAPEHGTLTFDQSVALGVLNLDNCIKGIACNYNTDVGSSAPMIGDTFVVYGFSQSATIATLEKRALAAEYAYGDGPDVTFTLTANGNRPNGGFLARGPAGVTIPWFLTFAGTTFSGPTPTDTQYATVDIAAEYDGWSDFPENPLNLLADANALMGITYLHLEGVYQDTGLTDPGVIDQGQYGDTSYYLISTPILPLLMPLENIPVIGHALADTLDAPLRVIVESAYDRSTSPGVPTSWNVFYFEDPIKLTHDFLEAVPTGLDNGMEDLFGVRPFGTERPGPYGVGGPDVEYTTPETAASASTDSSASATDSSSTSADQAPSTDESTTSTDTVTSEDTDGEASSAAQETDSSSTSDTSSTTTTSTTMRSTGGMNPAAQSKGGSPSKRASSAASSSRSSATKSTSSAHRSATKSTSSAHRSVGSSRRAASSSSS